MHEKLNQIFFIISVSYTHVNKKKKEKKAYNNGSIDNQKEKANSQ